MLWGSYVGLSSIKWIVPYKRDCSLQRWLLSKKVPEGYLVSFFVSFVDKLINFEGVGRFPQASYLVERAVVSQS